MMMYTTPLFRDPACTKFFEKHANEACVHCAEAAWSYKLRETNVDSVMKEHCDITCYCRVYCDVLLDTRESFDALRNGCDARSDE